MNSATAQSPACVRGLLLFGLGVSLLAGCRGDASRDPVKHEWLTMGTVSALSVGGADVRHGKELAAAAQQVQDDLAARLSVWEPESELSRLNRSAGGPGLEIAGETRELLRLSKQFGKATDGAFDITVLPVVRLWGFSGGKTPETMVPAEAVQQALERVGLEHVVIGEQTVSLARPGVSVDLGGIAKGYAVDRTCDTLIQRSATNFMVNLGGNMRCYGTAKDNRPWRVGVRNPLGRSLLGTLSLTGGAAVASSGNYERFVVLDGRRYAHIIDPRTGYPIEGMAGTTVIAPTAVEADGLSTALFVLGLEKGSAILSRFEECEALFVPDREPIEIWVTPGFNERFTPDAQFAPHIRIIGGSAAP